MSGLWSKSPWILKNMWDCDEKLFPYLPWKFGILALPPLSFSPPFWGMKWVNEWLTDSSASPSPKKQSPPSRRNQSPSAKVRDPPLGPNRPHQPPPPMKIDYFLFIFPSPRKERRELDEFGGENLINSAEGERPISFVVEEGLIRFHPDDQNQSFCRLMGTLMSLLIMGSLWCSGTLSNLEGELDLILPRTLKEMAWRIDQTGKITNWINGLSQRKLITIGSISLGSLGLF